ncbi:MULTISPECIES: hypothetical protein [Methylobacterium]|uniref:Clustering-based subsystem n=2 Tax=Methylobacterium TaxID=407 RepID=A0AAE8L9F6_9HYPH|nr:MULTISPECIES: hypothetical protein [Methylobacterium]MBA9065531.1 hypothetical protein [Methylobacterium fujisawaense]APT29925.1 clustering-based subsystem [Methylobacterium phyllosphaerae]MDH3029952.1 hypothetical protein [Methylobacterium fujisawaense]SFH63386.1 hypothetical protein SAMN05192567_13814 [Methylobacterium phyllosphaerae]SFV00057.1 hypothetical protein SAMN02799643_03804 [Methylobacterium sp. UNCCL125]
MRRPALLGLAGLVLLAVCLLAGGWRGAAASYLAAWLVLLALPVGALPVVIVAERFGKRVRERGGIEMLAGLRRLMALMPVAAVLSLPLLAATPLLYPWVSAPARTPLAALWFTVPFFAIRAIVYLAAWTWLALRFARPFDAPGEGRTVPAVGLHAIVGTLFVTDVVASLDPRLDSTLLGLLVMTAWSGLAFAAAILLAWEEPEPVGRGRTAPGRGRLVPLVVLLGLWAYLHFVQFLIVWSANLPPEVTWYFARGGWVGRALAVVAGAVVVLAGLATLRPGRPTTRILAGAAVAVHALEMFWLITPAVRDRFVLRPSDVLAAAAVACLAAALRPVLRPRADRVASDARRAGRPA